MVDDHVIIQQVLDGDVDRFEELIEKYKCKVFAIAGKRVPPADCAEVAQDAFLSCYQSLANYSFEKPFENWLTTIAMRACYNYWRRHFKRDGIFARAPTEDEMHKEWMRSADNAASLEQFELEVSRRETLEIVEQMLESLSPEDRLLIDMIYFEGMKLSEASEVLNWKLSKVKVRAMRAKKKMRLYIKGLGK